MARDYKNRARAHKKKPVPISKWLSVGALIVGFVTFLFFLQENKSVPIKSVEKPPPPKTVKKTSKREQKKKAEFQFYTILEQERKIPDYEIKIRKREEQLGRTQPGRYELQAGSFRKFAEADKRKAQLALLGVEARIEKIKVGDTNWNRIKIGPYFDMVKVDIVRTRLRENSIDVVVMKAD